MDELEEKKRELARLQLQRALAAEKGTLPEMEFDGSKRNIEPKISPKEKNYRDVLNSIVKKNTLLDMIKQNSSGSNTPPTSDSLSRNPSSVLDSQDSELEDLANIMATPYQPANDVKQKVMEIRETNPSRFKNLENLIKQKLDQRK